METALDLPPSMEAAHVDIFTRAHEQLFIQPAIKRLSSLQDRGVFDRRDGLFNDRLYCLTPETSPTPHDDPSQLQDVQSPVDSPSSPATSPAAIPPKDSSLEAIDRMLSLVDRHEMILQEDIARTTSILDNALASVRMLHKTAMLHTTATKRALRDFRNQRTQERLSTALEPPHHTATTSTPADNYQRAQTGVARTGTKLWEAEEGSALARPHVRKQGKQIAGLSAWVEHELHGRVVKNGGDGARRRRPGTRQGRHTPRAIDGPVSVASFATQATETISSRATNMAEQRSEESIATHISQSTLTSSPPSQLPPIDFPDQESDVSSLEQPKDLDPPPARPQKRSPSSSLEPPTQYSPTEITPGDSAPNSSSSTPHTSASSAKQGIKRKFTDTDTRLAQKHCFLA
ncbi:hypothetical protein BJ546DRAFT_988963 [Cryomyces antarcticus]